MIICDAIHRMMANPRILEQHQQEAIRAVRPFAVRWKVHRHRHRLIQFDKLKIVKK